MPVANQPGPGFTDKQGEPREIFQELAAMKLHHFHHGAVCVASLGLASVFAIAGASTAIEEVREVPKVAPDSISEVMLEDTGLELEDTAITRESVGAAVNTDAIVPTVEAEEAPPVPARAAPSR